MDNITKSLAEYSSTVNLYADQINGALLPVASILILTFFLFDVLAWNKKLGQEGGGVDCSIVDGNCPRLCNSIFIGV